MGIGGMVDRVSAGSLNGAYRKEGRTHSDSLRAALWAVAHWTPTAVGVGRPYDNWCKKIGLVHVIDNGRVILNL